MNVKSLNYGSKLVCVNSKIETFTRGKQYKITQILFDGVFVEGNDNKNHYIDRLQCKYYIFKPVKDEQQSHTPPHYQGSIQPIDLINAQDLNFNLGNVVKYVCRAGKKQGENILTDLEKAKDYINFEIERVKQ